MHKLITGLFFDIGDRDIYEDRVTITQLTTRSGLELTVALLADGVGGANRGERAAQLAIDMTLHYLKVEGTSQSVPQLLQHAFLAANQAVCSEVMQTQGASSTLTAAVIHNGRLYIANVGDSRIYLCRNGKLNQLTLDHTFAEIMPQLGKMSSEAAAANPRAEVLMRYVGSEHQFAADLGFYVETKDPQIAKKRGQKGLLLKPGDSILLCSDGLIKTAVSGKPFTTPTEIIRVLQTQEGDKAARSLVSFALGRNVDDNVSVALIQAPDPKRRRRARRPFIRTILLITILLLLGFLALYSDFQNKNAAAQASFNSQEITLAQEAQATVNAIAATATANQLTTQNDVAATADALATQQTNAAATAAAYQTEAANQLTCSLSGNYNYTVNDLQLLPKPTYQHIVGNRLPADFTLELRWSISNIGQCPLIAPILNSRDSNVPTLTPQWQQDGQLIEQLTPDETAVLHLTIPITKEDDLFEWRNQFNNNTISWWLSVAPSGDQHPINLLSQPPLSLQDGNNTQWLVFLQPTATSQPPTPTISAETAVPVGTPEPIEPTVTP